MGGHQTAHKGPQQDAGRDVAEDVPVDGAALVVGPAAGDGRDHDAGQRGAQGQLLHILGRDALAGEDRHQHGHDDDPAAHAQQAGKHTGHGAAAQIDKDGNEHDDLPP